MTLTRAAYRALALGLGMTTLACGSASPTAPVGPLAMTSSDSTATSFGTEPQRDANASIKGYVAEVSGTELMLADGTLVYTTKITAVLRNGFPNAVEKLQSGDAVLAEGSYDRVGRFQAARISAWSDSTAASFGSGAERLADASVKGYVEKVSEKYLVLAGGTVVFATESTEVLRNEAPSTLQKLLEGDGVLAEGSYDRWNNFQAIRISAWGK